MYDYKVSVRNYLDAACRDFVQAHNITAVAKAVGRGALSRAGLRAASAEICAGGGAQRAGEQREFF